MKWRNGRQGGNVQVDCLGLRADLGSPEADAAFACQEEVNNIRFDMMKSMNILRALKSGDSDFGIGSKAIERLADSSLTQQILEFQLQKQEQALRLQPDNPPPGKDTFKERLREFKEQVHIPESSQKHLY
ncbi:MAG: hypothetical protein KC777_28295 [Cyanobacteria bacterium HKST-UBA02]|nr:hypothetical protein [Cyanobacteria bacterium HKST-UBA02]